MKKIIAMLVAAAAFMSCTADDTTTTTVALTGTWKLTSIVVPSAWDLNNDGNYTYDLVAESGCLDNSSLFFDADGFATVRIQSLELEENNEGSQTTYHVACTGPEAETSAYTVWGSEVTFMIEGNPATFTMLGNTLATSQGGSTLTFTKI